MFVVLGAAIGTVLHFVPALRDEPASAEAVDRPGEVAASGRASEKLRVQVGRIVAAITEAAQSHESKPQADRRADYYIRAAARAALEESEGEPARGFVVALGFGLDRTGALARDPIVRLLFDAVESAEQQQRRRQQLGKLTLAGREDLLLHFAISAALTGLVDGPAAEAVGVQKEIADARGKERGRGSGFSFVDLAADLTGIELANVVLEDASQARARLRWIAEEYRSDAFFLDPRGLDEGLLYSDWAEQYGDASDPRFRDTLESLRGKVRACPGWAKLRAAGTPSGP